MLYCVLLIHPQLLVEPQSDVSSFFIFMQAVNPVYVGSVPMHVF